MKAVIILATVFVLGACSSKVIVKKDSCKDIYDGALMECEQVNK